MANSNSYKYWKWGAYLVIIAALFATISFLPLDDLSKELKKWIESLGIWGPVALGIIYVFATILFVPGTILTLVAGAVFGLITGFITVSIASVDWGFARILDRTVLCSRQGCIDGRKQSSF